MLKLSLHLLALVALLIPVDAWADSIASMKRDPSRDQTVEGDIITIWETSFLLDDGSGQAVVDVTPHKTRDLGIKARTYIQVSGRIVNGNVIKPLVISRANAEPVMFSSIAPMPELSQDEVMRNTRRNMLPLETMAANKPAASGPAVNTPAPGQPNVIEDPAAPTGSNRTTLPTEGSGSSGASPLPPAAPVK